LVFETLAYLKAVMDVIAEMDPAAPQEAPTVMYADFSCRQVQT
jgi:hypothetical protein